MLVTLTEEAQRCSSCGTAPWEWEENPFAYGAAVHVCQGCRHRDAAREDAAGTLGGSIVLVSGKAREAALAAAREAYMASRKRKREPADDD